MDRKGQVGSLKCRVCQADLEMRITSLSQPVDVFAEWIDQCDALNKSAAVAAGTKRKRE